MHLYLESTCAREYLSSPVINWRCEWGKFLLESPLAAVRADEKPSGDSSSSSAIDSVPKQTAESAVLTKAEDSIPLRRENELLREQINAIRLQQELKKQRGDSSVASMATSSAIRTENELLRDQIAAILKKDGPILP